MTNAPTIQKTRARKARRASISKTGHENLKRPADTIIKILNKFENDNSITETELELLQSLGNLCVETTFIASRGKICMRYIDYDLLKREFQNQMEPTIAEDSTNGGEDTTLNQPEPPNGDEPTDGVTDGDNDNDEEGGNGSESSYHPMNDDEDDEGSDDTSEDENAPQKDHFFSITKLTKPLLKSKKYISFGKRCTISFEDLCTKAPNRNRKVFASFQKHGTSGEDHSKALRMINILMSKSKKEQQAHRLTDREKKYIKMFEINPIIPLVLYKSPRLIEESSVSDRALLKQWFDANQQDIPATALKDVFCDFLDAMKAGDWKKTEVYFHKMGKPKKRSE
ncbi:uncharacterized protein SPPG_03310 [Spizellomyces punctatus DAOM BR117]|uniref:Uncharacterized protein n=1 Tax=Spizellomyces punctatus (strain DAOM BR117) TaxID=645134 RepID=A0A0L0HKE8_SPIPD|nr:uncharacterized protein SPPG_03310 [Spizellomyces punctatus DAOM BR117]KND01513.1 hypothetical protein SPPG_03310 [Spizellomyces punctatus DAOM BR117]|eukprot:XP_016609552.1 hypothetical protein SPPG_03310 [Spizellomyces punctatus DAOM BR117]